MEHNQSNIGLDQRHNCGLRRKQVSNPTTPFSWQMPTATDLVTDLPADFEVFGQAVATSMADLLGGTTGQILAKNSNTDMDFVWIANDQGDITGITATSPLTGGGTSGAITVGIQASSTTQSGAVQLSDSTSTTSSVLAATPTAVKSAYDLAAAAVPKSTVTTAGDVIYATGSAAVSRLGIGTAGQVLTVNSGATAPQWTTPARDAFIGCSLYKSADQSINNVTTTTITWDLEHYDTNTFHDNSTNNSRITIPAGYAGKYLIQVTLNWNSNSTSYREARIRLNGSTLLAYSPIQAASSGGVANTLNVVKSLSVADYIEIQGEQASGGALSISGGNAYSAQVQVTYMGA